MKTGQTTKLDRINEICEMYGNNAERIIAAAAEFGCRTDSWYVAANWIAQKTDEYLYATEVAIRYPDGSYELPQ